MIDNGNTPKHFQKLFTQRLFQTGYSRFYDTSRSQDFSLGWKSIQCSKKNSRKTWQLNEFLPFPLERGTIRSILKVLYYSGKIKDGRQFPSMIFKTQAYIAVLVLRSSTSLVFSLSFSSTFFFFQNWPFIGSADPRRLAWFHSFLCISPDPFCLKFFRETSHKQVFRSLNVNSCLDVWSSPSLIETRKMSVL